MIATVGSSGQNAYGSRLVGCFQGVPSPDSLSELGFPTRTDNVIGYSYCHTAKYEQRNNGGNAILEPRKANIILFFLGSRFLISAARQARLAT